MVNRLAKVAIMVIAITVPIYLAFTLMVSSQSYLTVSEVTSGGYEEKDVAVLGRVVNGSITIASNQIVFNITDGMKDSAVYYKGSVNLSDMNEVVVKGVYSA